MMIEILHRALSNAFIDDPETTLKEIISISLKVTKDFEATFFEKVFGDTKRLYEGNFPGYRASNTKYHDFNHTISVALATTRLIHGCSINGHLIRSRNMLLALVAALFHDVGLIQEKGDDKGSGAKYTVGHEERSIAFMQKYLAEKKFLPEEIEICSKFIRCTILSLPPKEIPFSSDELQNLGYIVGSADLSAQLADRLYLEKLLLLYKEFEEAGLPGFDSELELLQKTKDFYVNIAQKRFFQELNGVCVHMRSHFRQWMDIDKDLYNESIMKNIRYLEYLVALCLDSIECYLENLRRGDITQEIATSLDIK